MLKCVAVGLQGEEQRNPTSAVVGVAIVGQKQGVRASPLVGGEVERIGRDCFRMCQKPFGVLGELKITSNDIAERRQGIGKLVQKQSDGKCAKNAFPKTNQRGHGR